MNTFLSRRKVLIGITTVGIFSALSVVLVWLIHFPIFPAVSFLEYDPADIPIILISFIFGPWYGIAMTVIVSVVQGITVSAASGWTGIVMHILATGSLVLAAGLVKGKRDGLKRDAAAAFAGVLAMTVTMALWNLLFTPYFMGLTISQLLPFYPFIVGFNLIKAGINSFLGVMLYEVIGRRLKKTLI